MSFVGARDRLENSHGNALMLAIGGPSLLTALAVLLLTMADDVLDPGGLAGLFFFALIIAAAVIACACLLIGLPLTWLLARNRLERAWTYPLAGFAAGAAIVLLTLGLAGGTRGDLLLDLLPFAPAGAVPGGLCGAIWWIAYRRHMQDTGEQYG